MTPQRIRGRGVRRTRVWVFAGVGAAQVECVQSGRHGERREHAVMTPGPEGAVELRHKGSKQPPLQAARRAMGRRQTTVTPESEGLSDILGPGQQRKRGRVPEGLRTCQCRCLGMTLVLAERACQETGELAEGGGEGLRADPRELSSARQVTNTREISREEGDRPGCRGRVREFAPEPEHAGVQDPVCLSPRDATMDVGGAGRTGHASGRLSQGRHYAVLRGSLRHRWTPRRWRLVVGHGGEVNRTTWLFQWAAPHLGAERALPEDRGRMAPQPKPRSGANTAAIGITCPKDALGNVDHSAGGSNLADLTPEILGVAPSRRLCLGDSRCWLPLDGLGPLSVPGQACGRMSIMAGPTAFHLDHPIGWRTGRALALTGEAQGTPALPRVREEFVAAFRDRRRGGLAPSNNDPFRKKAEAETERQARRGLEPAMDVSGGPGPQVSLNRARRAQDLFLPEAWWADALGVAAEPHRVPVGHPHWVTDRRGSSRGECVNIARGPGHEDFKQSGALGWVDVRADPGRLGGAFWAFVGLSTGSEHLRALAGESSLIWLWPSAAHECEVEVWISGAAESRRRQKRLRKSAAMEKRIGDMRRAIRSPHLEGLEIDVCGGGAAGGAIMDKSAVWQG
ncbi:hypothetical protein DMN91_003144 [Ooceraea biroi]|uniref:Uncharacterized protein n=1 Tax=Ooceraea biroi TaxID=2015173 RepID=A0A3L8DXN1_OOCBI|nr:hypothetical protein DMN91_003144 [Ooceraea biroi]